MYIKYNNEEIECVTTLRVAMNIQKKFRKPYLQVLSNIEELDLEEQIKILFCGIELGKDNNIIFEDFKNYVLDNIGLEQLENYLESFINSIQYPGLSEEEIEKKLIEKIEKQKKLREIGLNN